MGTLIKLDDYPVWPVLPILLKDKTMKGTSYGLQPVTLHSVSIMRTVHRLLRTHLGIWSETVYNPVLTY